MYVFQQLLKSDQLGDSGVRFLNSFFSKLTFMLFWTPFGLKKLYPYVKWYHRDPFLTRPPVTEIPARILDIF